MSTLTQNKTGITLVALVVTIIVLLILAGISLNLIGGSNGILRRAQKAASTMEIAKIKESKELSDASILIDMYAEGENHKTLYDYIKDKCEQNEDKVLETENGKYWLDENNNLHYKDKETEDDAKIVEDAQGNLLIKEITDKKGNVQDMTNSENLTNEIEVAIKNLVKEYQKEYGTKDQEKTFTEFIEEKCQASDKKYVETANGGKLYPGESGTLIYEDSAGNYSNIIVDNDGKVIVKEMTSAGGEIKDMTTEDSLKSEIDKAMTELKKEWQESGSTDSFEEWLKKKIEENGGSLSTSTGGTISVKEDGTFVYEDSTTPANTGDFIIDSNGKIKVENVEINQPQNSGNVNEDTIKLVKDLLDTDITFQKKIAGTDDWNADWINQNVVVTAVPNIDLTGYTLQTSKNNVTWKNVDNQTFTINGTFYVRAFNGKRAGKVIQTEITNIDKQAPEISVETTTNSYEITATDEISKIAGYKITETAGEPESFDPVDLQETFTTTGEGAQGQTFYAWAKDKAGNVTSKEFTLKEVPSVANKDFDYTYEPTGWTNQDVLVTAELKNSANFAGFTVQTSKDGANWESDNSQNFAENGKMFVRLIDAKGQAGRTTAEAIVDKIDKVEPKIDTVTATTKSYQFEASDEDSGLAGYQITETEEEPTTFETIENGAKTFTSPIMENQKNNRPYYIWLKDVAGNIIYKKVNLQAVDTATSTNVRVQSTNWSGTSATVTFETTSTYQMQICTKASKNDEDWENKSVVTVESGTPIYVRLWDGVNGGNYFTYKPVITYQVQYNANGGTGSMANSTHEYGTAKALTANAFSKTGYTFGGWATSAGGAKVYDNSQSVTNLSSTNGATVELWAVWNINQYTVTYNANGGTGSVPNQQSGNYNATVNVGFSPVPTKSNAVFLGWSTNSGATSPTYTSGGTKTITLTGNVNLYAIWHNHVDSCYSTACRGSFTSSTSSESYATCNHSHTGSSSSGGGCYGKANTTTCGTFNYTGNMCNYCGQVSSIDEVGERHTACTRASKSVSVCLKCYRVNPPMNGSGTACCGWRWRLIFPM